MNNYKAMLESIYEGIYFVNKEREITFWNRGAEYITGFRAAEVNGSFCYNNILNHVDETGKKLCLLGCPLGETIKDGQPRELTIYLHHKEGHRVKISTRVTPIVEDGEIIGAVEVFTNRSNTSLLLDQPDIEKYTVDNLKILALYDQLTMIPNRRYIENFLEARMKEYRELGIEFGVLFMDIDHFRDFNNNFGHEIGDKVLQMVAKTFASSVRQTDMAGRWGGEEFIGVFSRVDFQNLARIAEKIRMLVENSVLREGEVNHHVTMSIGGTMIQPQDTTESLVKRADQAMYQSKQNGRNQVTII